MDRKFSCNILKGSLLGTVTCSREAILIKLFCLPSEKGVHSKRKVFASLGKQILSIKRRPLLEGVQEKGIYTKRKYFAPLGSKFFPFRVDHFQKGYKKKGSPLKEKNLLP